MKTAKAIFVVGKRGRQALPDGGVERRFKSDVSVRLTKELDRELDRFRIGRDWSKTGAFQWAIQLGLHKGWFEKDVKMVFPSKPQLQLWLLTAVQVEVFRKYVSKGATFQQLGMVAVKKMLAMKSDSRKPFIARTVVLRWNDERYKAIEDYWGANRRGSSFLTALDDLVMAGIEKLVDEYDPKDLKGMNESRQISAIYDSVRIEYGLKAPHILRSDVFRVVREYARLRRVNDLSAIAELAIDAALKKKNLKG